jgi:hypothetical protein
VHRPEQQGAEDEEIQRALEQVDTLGRLALHGRESTMYDDLLWPLVDVAEVALFLDPGQWRSDADRLLWPCDANGSHAHRSRIQ